MVSYVVKSIDIGPVLTDNLLKSNRKIVHSSHYHRLSLEELSISGHVSLQNIFVELLEVSFGSDTSLICFKYINK